MNFFLMRHGEAEAFATSDQQRSLTASGEVKIRQRIGLLQPQLAKVDCIIHSPYLRTSQTAAIVAELLAIEKLHSSEFWVPEAQPLQALADVEQWHNCTPMFVTHMPLIASLEALAIGDDSFPRPFSCAEIAFLTTQYPVAGLAKSRRI